MASSRRFYFLVALFSLLIIKVAGEEGELYFHFLQADIKSLQFNQVRRTFDFIFSIFSFSQRYIGNTVYLIYWTKFYVPRTISQRPTFWFLVNNNNTFFLFSVVKTTQILSRQSQPTHKKGRSSYCMIKIKIDPLVSSVTMQRQEKLVRDKLPAIERQQGSSSLFSSSLYANRPERFSLSTSS